MSIQCPNRECLAENPANAKFCRKCGTAFSSIKCKKCNTENPANAKFCRKCGTAFSSIDRFKQIIISAISRMLGKKAKSQAETFTLDTFRNISFQPVSVVKIRFINRFVVFLFILLAALWRATIIGLTGDIISEIDDYFYEDFISIQYDVAGVCLAISCLFALFIIKSWIKRIRYKLNADYIEDRFINDGIVRIARKSRMGLFDKKKKKVLLPSAYSNIEKFDNQHLLVSKGNKHGLFSLTYRKVIIPVMYDSISPFVNSVATATLQGVEHHYDVKGNELR